jgi:2-succinyl-6-hydroxy-2,4-cyclohexadiene-1-carboxylate synthase
VTTSSGVTLFVVVAGDGPPLLLLHGFTGAGAAWGDLPLRLARHHRVVVPDLPGHGASDPLRDPERFTWDAVTEMLAEVLDEVAPGPVTWAGYSMGGRIALSAAASGRVSPAGLIVESASPGLADASARESRREADEAWARRLEREELDHVVDAWLAQPLFATQRRLPRLIRDAERARRLDSDAPSLAACLRGLGTGSQPSWWDELGRVTCPVLLVNGSLDEKFDALAGAMAERLPTVRRARVRGAGHAVHLEKPEAWLAEVTPFLEGLRSDGG